MRCFVFQLRYTINGKNKVVENKSWSYLSDIAEMIYRLSEKYNVYCGCFSDCFGVRWFDVDDTVQMSLDL